MKSQEAEVSEFFNEISDGYKSKYSGKDAFLGYFFNERLNEATRGFEFEGKRVLDIGAGTGDLYDALSPSKPDYYACDIAAGMLESSNIPVDRRFVGVCHEVEFPVNEFDIVYMLGVTTYLPDEELEKTIDFVSKVLRARGEFVVTFTNRTSLDWFFRKLTKTVLKRIGNKSNVLGQSFQIYPLSNSEALAKTATHFDHVETRWLNHTVFPFYHLSKGLAAKLAESIHPRMNSGFLASSLSSDFMLILERK